MAIIPTDVKDPLPTVILNATEIAVFDEIFNANDNSGETDEEPKQSANRIVSVGPGGNKLVTELIDNDCEMSYELGSDLFKPQDVEFQIKLNDIFSGNLPFKENVC